MACSLLIAALTASALLLTVWLLFGAFVLPLPAEPTQSLVAELKVTGASRSLEQTVAGLVWLARSGAMSMSIIITDEGMDEETRTIAQNIERRFGEVSLHKAQAR